MRMGLYLCFPPPVVVWMRRGGLRTVLCWSRPIPAAGLQWKYILLSLDPACMNQRISSGSGPNQSHGLVW